MAADSSDAIAIARLEEQVKTLFTLATDTKKGVEEINRKMEGGCPFGKNTRRQLTDAEKENEKLSERVTRLELFQANLKGKWVSVAALAWLVWEVAKLYFGLGQ